MTIRIFSPSQLATWNTCNLRFFWRYVEGIKSPPGIAAVIGSATHKSVEMNLRAKLEEKPMGQEEALQIAADELALKWKTEKPVEDEDGALNEGEATDQAVGLAKVHYREVAPLIDPKAIEAHFNEPQVDGYDFGLQGYVDIITKDGLVRDTKTMGRRPDAVVADRGDKADQLTSYVYLSHETGGVAIDALVKTKKPYSHTVVGQTRTQQDFDILFRKYQLMARSIDAGIFHPAPGDSWQCSKKWCGYYEMCEFGEKKAVTIPVANLTKKRSLLDDVQW